MGKILEAIKAVFVKLFRKSNPTGMIKADRQPPCLFVVFGKPKHTPKSLR